VVDLLAARTTALETEFAKMGAAIATPDLRALTVLFMNSVPEIARTEVSATMVVVNAMLATLDLIVPRLSRALITALGVASVSTVPASVPLVMVALAARSLSRAQTTVHKTESVTDRSASAILDGLPMIAPRRWLAQMIALIVVFVFTVSVIAPHLLADPRVAPMQSARMSVVSTVFATTTAAYVNLDSLGMIAVPNFFAARITVPNMEFVISESATVSLVMKERSVMSRSPVQVTAATGVFA